MEDSFWALIWSSFKKVQGIFTGILAIAVALFLWRLSPDTGVKLSVALPIAIILVIVILTFINAAHDAYHKSKRNLPKMIFAQEPPQGAQDIQAICLLMPSDLFSYDCLVTFYYLDDEGFEVRIGLGKVTNIQDDKKIQVALMGVVGGHEEKAAEMIKNNKKVLDRIRVKPIVQSSGFLGS